MPQKDRYAYYLSYSTLVTLIPLFGTKLFELRRRGIFGGFMQENKNFWFSTKTLCKIRQLYLFTVTQNSLSTKGVSRSPGWQFYILQWTALSMRGFQNLHEGKVSYEGKQTYFIHPQPPPSPPQTFLFETSTIKYSIKGFFLKIQLGHKTKVRRQQTGNKNWKAGDILSF